LSFNPPLTIQEVEAAFNGTFSKVTPIVGGTGGQGVVFRAESQQQGGTLPKTVALKIYYPGSLVERTQREVQALAKLQCDYIVRIHSAGHIPLRAQPCMFVGTDFIEGEVLSAVVSRGRLNANQAARVGHDIAIAISALWTERLVHRDIKPHNIMLARNNRGVLIDLGVARHLSLGALTTIGKTWGTDGYMSPEQANALRQLSCKSDIFSLGIVLQELLLGAHPTGCNQLALAGGGVKTAALKFAPRAPFEALLDTMLALSPHHRPNPVQVAETLNHHV
jgi:serine/threonine-protein kinase